MKQNLRLRGGLCLDNPSDISHWLSAYSCNNYKNIDRLIDASWRQYNNTQGQTKTTRYKKSNAHRFLASRLPADRQGKAISKDLCKPNSNHTVSLKLFAIPSGGRLFGFTLLKRTTYNLQLKRPISFSLSALSFTLIILLFHVRCATARQPQDLGAATGVALTDSIKPLQIGDSIPEALWNLPLQMVKAGQEGNTTVKLKDYKGKLIILDFWATYCKPCIKSIEKLDSIQQQLEQVVLMPVLVYDLSDRALPFMKRKEWAFPSVVNDTIWNKTVLKHYLTGFGTAWIYKGKLVAVPRAADATEENIRKILSGELSVLKRKETVN